MRFSLQRPYQLQLIRQTNGSGNAALLLRSKAGIRRLAASSFDCEETGGRNVTPGNRLIGYSECSTTYTQ